RRLDTWQSTLFAARATQIRAKETGQALPGFHSFVSPVLRGGQPALHVVVDIASLDRLWLIATVGGDNYNFDQAIWGEPKLIDAAGAETPLSSVKPTSAQVGWGTLLTDNNHTNQGLRVGGTTFARGFWAHAPSQLRFDLPHRSARFEAWVGVDMAAGGNGTVSFKVMDEADTTDTAPTLWLLLARDFTRAAEQREMGWEREDGLWEADWKPGDVTALAGRYAAACRRVPGLLPEAEALATRVDDQTGLDAVRQVYYRSRRLAALLPRLGALPVEPLRRAVNDLSTRFGARYPNGGAYLTRLDAIAAAAPAAVEAAKAGSIDAMDAAVKLVESFDTLQREALLANPLLDFDRLLLVRRRAAQLGLPQNWQGNSTLPRSGFDNALVSLAWRDPDSPYQTVFQPTDGHFVGDVDLHWNADRLLFSSLDAQNRWQVFEIRPDGSALRQVTPGDQPAVDNYDACYLPNGDILFDSTAPFVGVPCVFGSDHVAVLFRCDADGKHVRQLCFEQDHDWCPTVLNNGRVLYTRWEYADTPHSQTRLLFHMNPDGTEQSEYLKSNSYWPNGFFYARPIPGHPTEVVTVISGHHGVPRMGELVLFDPARGRYEADGAVQRIPGHGQKVEPVIRDALVDGSWPKFLHPYPLSDSYFLVSMQPDAQSPWGLYLVDRFDNLLCLRAEPEWALLEPLPLRKTPVPPVVPDKVDPRRRDALVYLENIYAGPGLKGVPRGAVKKLRVLSYEFAYHNMGGLLGVLGMEGPWDIKRILGTVPVNEDGSAFFRVPANTPLSVQPLDSEGKALQLMRSWMTAMPHAELDDGHARRDAVLRGVPRAAEQLTRQRRLGGAAAGARPDPAVVWAGARFQLPTRSAAGDRPLLHHLPRRRRRERPARHRADQGLPSGHAGHGRPGGRAVLGGLRRAAPLRAAAGDRERPAPAQPARVPRR
ncbi:MAG: NPCBM/NEW2 domain-containing protein, partial [Armatimonadetes bacterium]|nr:NPCBM/NEW2 domain-containing protein [Armatimonadota bacterium]